MSEQANILFIVEGERLEPDVIRRMRDVYGLRCEVSSVCTNIHILYKKLKQDDGYSDVIAILQEILCSRLNALTRLKSTRELQHKSTKELLLKIKMTQEDLATLARPFASVYLVFDSELHDSPDKTTPPEQTIKNNVAELKEMLEFFDNETEHGKLYVNYPMMESFRDCNDFFEDDYKDRLVPLEVFFDKSQEKQGYKTEIASRKLASIHIDKLSKEQFNRLTCMNVFKLNWMMNKIWGKPTYDDFLLQSQQNAILDMEYECCRQLKAVAVLNTLLFFIIDYKGRVFYDGSIAP